MREQGFTLVELLVALTIFALLSAAGVTLLSFSVRAQALADERMSRLAEIRRAGALLTSDLAQAAPRISRDEAGAVRAAMIGRSGQGDAMLLSLVRRGWENLDGSNRPSLQKVTYRWVAGRLERTAYRNVDGASAMDPVAVVTGVRQVRMRYRDPRGEWRERWDPTQPTLMPTAVEMQIETEESGSIRQLFLVGTAI